MQFKVPQDVQREDRIVGPLTLRQLIICGIGFSMAYAIYTFVGRDYEVITALIPVIIIAIITITFAFVKPLDLVFEKYILFLIESLVLPPKRFWLKGTGDPSRLSYIPAPSAKKKINPKEAELAGVKKKKSIEEITKILDKKYQ
ncbi:PrgI family protein [Candidatus Peregrinibacteria bacterium]|nr:PrgI family protein [Candidatus Peregrinibacteria bacterium]